MTEWQPIETAPKDGSRVLLWSTTEITESDRAYVADVCEGEHVIGAQIGFWCCERHEWDLELIGEPTHWMPLPEAPAARRMEVRCG